MMAITVHQPWAWAIIRGGKDVENRTRIGTWRRLVGERVAIHAGQKWSTRGAESDLVIDAVARDHNFTDQQVLRPLPSYLFSPGVLLGVVTVDDVHEEQGGCCAPWGERHQQLVDRMGQIIREHGPFAGIMSVPFCAVKLGRRGVGCELNTEYWRDGVAHVQAIARGANTPTLFDLESA